MKFEFKFIPLIIVVSIAITGLTMIGIVSCKEMKQFNSSNKQAIQNEPPTIDTPIFIKKSERMNEYHRLYKELNQWDKSPAPRPTVAEIIGLQIEILNAIREETLFSR